MRERIGKTCTSHVVDFVSLQGAAFSMGLRRENCFSFLIEKTIQKSVFPSNDVELARKKVR